MGGMSLDSPLSLSGVAAVAHCYCQYLSCESNVYMVPVMSITFCNTL